MQAFFIEVLRADIKVTGPRLLTGNVLRGALGAAIQYHSPAHYARYFAPEAQSPGPSGFENQPRPFTLRLREPGVIRINLFAHEATPVFEAALQHVHAIGIRDIQREVVRIPIRPSDSAVRKLRIDYLTATELKGADEPSFGALLARLRDRISNLRALWGEGPLDLDFQAFGERAGKVKMTRCQLNRVAEERLSKATGQRHSLSGFTGFAEYEGDMAEFIPYLEIGRYTGVGRQTVWGKGEIAYEKTD